MPNSYLSDNIKVNHEERFVMFAVIGGVPVRVPFYEIKQVNVFHNKVTFHYNKSNMMTYKGRNEEVKNIVRQVEKAQLSVRNAS